VGIASAAVLVAAREKSDFDWLKEITKQAVRGEMRNL
jgi:hypothetical protein